MTIAAQFLRRALAEDLAMRKNAFIPLDKNAQQAAGPSGAPVDPTAAAGAPPGAGAAPPPGGAPMDAPMPDPSAAAGAAPTDPSAGMPPPDAGAPAAIDPAAGAASGDPTAGGDPMAGAMPPPDVNSADTDVDNNGKPDTMVPLSGMKDFAIGLIEAMKGKKTQDADMSDAGGDAGAAPAGPPPGPVTGLPGDLSGLPGPLPMKTAAVLGRPKRASALNCIKLKV